MRPRLRRLRETLAARRGDLPIVLALLLAVAAVALPPVLLSRPTFDYLVVFDITQSMDVEDQTLDGAAVSRLAHARAAARETLRTLPCGSRLGWAVFADYRVMPLLRPIEVCAHYDALLGALERIDGRMRWANASNVGKGITWGLRTARAIGPKTHLVFFTDGQESPPLRDGAELPPTLDLTPGEVTGWVVGVGGDLPARIPRTDRDGRAAGYWAAADVVQRSGAGAAGSHEHLSELREPHLQAVARHLQLDYQRLAEPAALASRLREPRFAEPAPVATDLRALPAVLALALLVWRFRPDRGGRRRRPDGAAAAGDAPAAGAVPATAARL